MGRRGLAWRWGGAVALVLALAGCAGGGSAGPTPSPEVTVVVSVGPVVDPPSDEIRVLQDPAAPLVVPPADVVAGVGWVPDRTGVLWVMTFGSSSNPMVASGATAHGQTITVALTELVPGGPASADHVPWTSYIVLPTGVDPTTPITVVLGDLGSTELTVSEAWVPATP